MCDACMHACMHVCVCAQKIVVQQTRDLIYHLYNHRLLHENEQSQSTRDNFVVSVYLIIPPFQHHIYLMGKLSMKPFTGSFNLTLTTHCTCVIAHLFFRLLLFVSVTEWAIITQIIPHFQTFFIFRLPYIFLFCARKCFVFH